jgi:UDP-N-acetylmuramoyl-tripeptide--D-alanyl-D-alanine ligase
MTINTPEYSFNVKTQLVGIHNVANILMATAVVYVENIDMKKISEAISSLQATPHRLELKRINNELTILDDAFNANPVGTKVALDVLAEMPGEKIVITPGMIDLGKKEKFYNHEYGKQMADVVDVAYLIGMKQTENIYRGLKEKNFTGEQIVCETFIEAYEQATARPGKKTILIANDLPDKFNA